MKQVWIVSGLVVAALAVAALIVKGHDKPDGPSPLPPIGQDAEASGLPWQIEVLRNGGSMVMGLTLSHDGRSGSTLQAVSDQWGQGMEVAIVAAPGEDGTLEAFVDPASAGFITGKAVITVQLPAAEIRAMRERAVKSAFMDSTTRKYTLAAADLQAAMKAPIQSLSFIPQANLDEATVVGRFGQPAERVRGNAHVEHFLYPGKGLDLVLDTEGKELLQYVAPARFELLRAPLKADLAGPTGSTASRPRTPP
jgi:hypothetical protein